MTLPLFVYGSLRPGLAAHDALCRDATRIRPAWAPGCLILGAAGYPILIPDQPGRVRGELLDFACPTAALARLDAYEGLLPADPDCPYERRLVQAWADGSAAASPIRCWCYVLRAGMDLGPGWRVVPGGDIHGVSLPPYRTP